MGTATIRQVRRRDEVAVTELWQALLESQTALDDRFRMSDDALERWQNDFPTWLGADTRRLFVAEEDGQVVGFATAERWTPSPVYAPSVGVYVSELYVDDEARREGVGQQLVEAVRGWAETLGADHLRVGVLAENAAGEAFWKTLGATPFSTTYTIGLAPTPTPEERPKGRLGF